MRLKSLFDMESEIKTHTKMIRGCEHLSSIRKAVYVRHNKYSEDSVLSIATERLWSCQCVSSLEDAIQFKMEHDFHVGIIDIEFIIEPGAIRLVETLFLHGPHVEWIALVGPDAITSPEVSGFISKYFFDFQTRPINSSILANTMGHALGMAHLKRHANDTRAPYYDDNGIIGGSYVMQKLFSDLYKLKNVETPVLILGESGTGKELVAKAIHNKSLRSNAPFIVVNCGAIPENLVQSELFGHEKGAFTGACRRKLGKLELAAGGTILLDEIGDLPLPSQVNLLRFLQETTIERVGGTESLYCDVRLIAATHVDLRKAVADGQFREDLYHRLSVIQISVPPLRDRGHDIEVLARYCFNKFSSEKNTLVKGFSCKAIEAMYEYQWPGNVRELINKVRQAMIMSDHTLITPEDLRLSDNTYSYSAAQLSLTRASAERQAIVDMLESNVTSLSQAARKLGISRSTLYRLFNKYQIEAPRKLLNAESKQDPSPAHER